MSSSNGNEDVIRIMCPNLSCKRILAVPTTARGKLVRCRGCGINLRIPIGKTAAATPTTEGATKPAVPAKSGTAPGAAATSKAA